MDIKPKVLKASYIKDLSKVKKDNKEYIRKLYIDIEQREGENPLLFVNVTISDLNEKRFQGGYEEWPQVDKAVKEAMADFDSYKLKET